MKYLANRREKRFPLQGGVGKLPRRAVRQASESSSSAQMMLTGFSQGCCTQRTSIWPPKEKFGTVATATH